MMAASLPVIDLVYRRGRFHFTDSQEKLHTELDQMGGICRIEKGDAFKGTACVSDAVLMFVGDGEQTKALY